MTDQPQDMRALVPTLPPGTTVAVTGATGFIGGRLVECLVEQGAVVTCLLRGAACQPAPSIETGAKMRTLDLAEPEPVRAAMEGIEFIFHCAYDGEDTAWNFAALSALIEACRANGCRRLVHLSSFVVYQLPPEGEVTEESAEDTSGAGYAHTKRELESELLRAAREDGVPGRSSSPRSFMVRFRAHGRSTRRTCCDRHGRPARSRGGDLQRGLCGRCRQRDDPCRAAPCGRGSALPRLRSQSDHLGAILRRDGAGGWCERAAISPRRGGRARTGEGRKLLRLAADPEGVVRRVAQIRTLPQAGASGSRRAAAGPSRERAKPAIRPNDAPARLCSRAQSRPSPVLAVPGDDRIRQGERELGYAPQFDFATGWCRPPVICGTLTEAGRRRQSAPGSIVRGGVSADCGVAAYRPPCDLNLNMA